MSTLESKQVQPQGNVREEPQDSVESTPQNPPKAKDTRAQDAQSKVDDAAEPKKGKQGRPKDKDESGEKDLILSWMLEVHPTSEPEFPIARVVRTPMSNLTKLRKVKVEPIDPIAKKQQLTVKTKPQGGKKYVDSDCVDITPKVTPTTKPKPSSKLLQYPKPLSPISAFSDPEDNARAHAMDNDLNNLLAYLQKKDKNDFGLRHSRILAPSQRSPFVGSSVVQRIIFSVHPGDGYYDPFEAVKTRKRDRLYGIIQWMTPTQSLQDLTPFRRDGRVAFLDPLLTVQWFTEFERDFEKNEKSWVFGKGYFDHANGLAPNFAVTRQRWFKDVDLLYLVHNIGAPHWFAVEVDIPKKKTDKEIKKEVRAYAKLVPLLLHQMFPAEWKSTQAFYSYRMKNIPQNDQTGDCGVYTLKFIECLALGSVMDDLKDENMADIRLKYAAEIMDEIPAQWF
ncbi:hypothetical protein EUTSA_v10002320mg [Eutrema salsugineum]|uniref:Ubiquitin-like protease family profile domain-containing protein n=1 Tax=Eutrema salsugineum TaxID=72664 RepID=V4M5N8_EUTSA|nr:hypothetical protein EUTSA_v10002320mg [Eutrema salsugineum]